MWTGILVHVNGLLGRTGLVNKFTDLPEGLILTGNGADAISKLLDLLRLQLQPLQQLLTDLALPLCHISCILLQNVLLMRDQGFRNSIQDGHPRLQQGTYVCVEFTANCFVSTLQSRLEAQVDLAMRINSCWLELITICFTEVGDRSW